MLGVEVEYRIYKETQLPVTTTTTSTKTSTTRITTTKNIAETSSTAETMTRRTTTTIGSTRATIKDATDGVKEARKLVEVLQKYGMFEFEGKFS